MFVINVTAENREQTHRIPLAVMTVLQMTASLKKKMTKVKKADFRSADFLEKIKNKGLFFADF